MTTDTRTYALGTSLTQRFPWGIYVAGRVQCADGKVRALARISATADTFFSVPAAVKVGGRTVSGYVAGEAISGSSVSTPDDPTVIRFHAVTYGKNHGALPDWPRDDRSHIGCRYCERARVDRLPRTGTLPRLLPVPDHVPER